MSRRKNDSWYDDFVFIPNDTRRDFEAFVGKLPLSTATLERLRHYVQQHGRRRVLSSVKTMMPQDLDRLQGIAFVLKRR